jgi:Zn-dependent protease
MDGFDSSILAVGLAWYIVFLFSTTLHEAAHALVAYLGGDRTAYEGGQVSLDPLPHIRREPFGMVIVPLLTLLSSKGSSMFGWASAPYDPYWARRFPRRAALMALAGPSANLLLVGLSFVGLKVGLAMGVFEAPLSASMSRLVQATVPGQAGALALLLSIGLTQNLLLAILNLLPFPPLDGSSAITLLMDRGLAERWNDFIRQPVMAMVGLLVAWRVVDVVFSPAFSFALAALHPGVGYE